jgi:hypothetical protein
METAFVSIICVALMVIGGMTMSQGFLRSVDNTTNNIQVISQRDEDIMRTNIAALSASMSAANTLNVRVRNSGQTKLASFDKWDIIVHYTDGSAMEHVTWLPYSSSLEDNRWTVTSIYYVDAGGDHPEVFDPGILNPEEEMDIRCQFYPAIGSGTVNMIAISTPNGITVSKTFTGYSP